MFNGVHKTIKIVLTDKELLQAVQDYLLVHKDTCLDSDLTKLNPSPYIHFSDSGNLIVEYNEAVS